MATADVSGAIPRRPWRALGSGALWGGCAHLAADGAIALAAAAVLLALVAGIVLLPVALSGVPVVVAAGWALGRLAALERRRFAATCRVKIPAPPRVRRVGPLLPTLRSLARDRCVWRELGYFVALVPVSAVTGAGVALAWAVPLTLVALPGYYDRLPRGRAALGPVSVDSFGESLVVSVAAVLFGVFVSPVLVRALAALDAALGRALLAPPRDLELTERVVQLTSSRDLLLAAVEAERKRIERDLHDGAQQRLVAVAMTLGRVVSRLRKSGDEATREIVEGAREDARAAITELRELARGLHPPVLGDRGLGAALTAVAARAPVPVTVDVQAEPRPPAAVESAAYFVVTEALTNVAKHAGASRAWVEIRRDSDRLRVIIGDDGTGGADPGRGSGLAGLAGRVAGIDGTLTVTSPPGGPTLIEVDVQCG
ncbi:sensor histidine kinase [Streptomyces halstedii]|uniref:sensor histidine kinase n=1 Tax=Streptomyces halstedii TaxID=1944 RepID=UPI00381965A2